MGLNGFTAKLLDKPSVTDTPFCAICGRPAHDAHHVIEKGMGGVTRRTEKRIPKMRLCGNGNVSGCHGLLHQMKLHVYWDDSMGGWVFWRSYEPMGHFDAWQQHHDEYLPVPGWVEQKEGSVLHVFGSGKAMR